MFSAWGALVYRHRRLVGGYIVRHYDMLASMRERTPWAVGMTMLVSAVVLFLLFGSIVLPIKAGRRRCA